MPQYYSVLDNGQGKAKGKAMPRRNQNRTYGTKKVNYRMREGSNYYGEVSGVKTRKSAEDRRLAASAAAAKAKNTRSAFGRAEDARFARGKKTSNKTADTRARGGARTSGRTADSRGRGNTSRGYLTAEANRQSRKAPSKNYRKGLYR
jgi:hypothetical protein